MYLFQKILTKFFFIIFLISNYSVLAVEDNYVGLGLNVSKIKDYILVNDVFKEGPAFISGLKINDKITHINGILIKNKTLEDSIKLMKGKVDSKVILTIQKKNNTSKNITIVRKKIEVPLIIKGVNLINKGNLNEGYEILLQLAKNGNPEAQYYIGQMNGLDQYNIKNYEKSFYWTKLSADQNFPDAFFYLGGLYSNGRGVKKDLFLGHDNYLKAAEYNIPESYLSLAYNYFFGDGVSKNLNEAVKWFNKTINSPVMNTEYAKLDKIDSYQGLHTIYMWEEDFVNYDEAFKYANLLLKERGDGKDYERLGYMYRYGYGVTENDSKAAEYYQIAINIGNLVAKESMADLYFYGEGLDQNYSLAYKMYNELIENENYKSKSFILRKLGEFYQYGYGDIKINFSKSLSFFKQSYDNGKNLLAAQSIGELYFKELDNYEEAIYWLEIGLQSPFGKGVTAELLAQIYEYGDKNVQDINKAFNYYKIAGDSNYSNGSFAVGRFYEEGLHGVQDYEKAAYWYQKSAEEGLSTGALKLAELYNTEKLGKNSKEKANYWYQYSLNIESEQGAEKGIIASKTLGLNYILGKGVEKNVNLGLSYLIDSAYVDPSTIFDLANLTKNKIIKRKQAKEIFSLIEERSKYDNVTKVSLALIYNLEALYIKKDIEKFEKILREVINSPYIDFDIHHVYAYVFLGTYLAETNYQEAESLLRTGLIDIQDNSTDKSSLLWSLDFLITTLTDIYNYFGDVHKVEILSKQLLEDPNTDSTQYLTKNILSCNLITSLNAQHKYLEALTYFNNCYKFTEDAVDNNLTNLTYKLMEIILLAKTKNIKISKNKYQKIKKEINFYYNNISVSDPSLIMALEASTNYYLSNYNESLLLFKNIEDRINNNKTLVFDNTLIYATDYLKALKQIGEVKKALEIAQTLINQRLENGSIQTLIQKNYILREFNEIYIELLLANSNENITYIDESLIVSQLSKNSDIAKHIQSSLFKLSLQDNKLKELVSRKQKLEYQLNNIFSVNKNDDDDLNENNLLRKNKLWDKINKQIQKINKKISKSYPEYYELLQPKLYTKDQIQNILKKDEVIISTFTGNYNSYVWFIFKDYIHLQKININKDNLSDIIKELRLSLSQSEIINASQLKSFNINLSNHLYNLIFDNIESKFESINKIYYVLDGPLQSLPLEVLVTNKNNNNYNEVSWLINKFEITYLTSVNDLISAKNIQNSNKISTPKKYIAFADPYLSDEDSKTRSTLKIDNLFDNRGIVSVEEIKKLPSLPETAEEVKMIAKILEANDEDIYLQNNANENKVKSINLYNSKVISFATHGLISKEIKGLTEPALVLTPPKVITKENDGLLKSSEIALLNLNSELVVLSACNTAASDGTPGAEGLSGLAKSFFIAGSKSILVSHWPVFSESTKDMMIDLFSHVQKDELTYSKSLQKAKISMIKNNKYDLFAHPTFWAPFVLVGIN